MSKYYSIKVIEDFIQKHCDECLYATDSVVGLGDQIWSKKSGGFFEVREHYLNCWSSGQTVRQFSNLSKRQLKLIDDESKNILLTE